MSDEENRFVRSQGGHDANELHNHGGQDDAREEKTAREDLEDAIEALDEDEGRVEVKSTKKIDVFDDDIEVPVDPADIEPEVDPEDPIEEKKIAEAKKIEAEKAEEAAEEAIEEDAKAEEDDWKDKEENKVYMKIDSVEEPKAKTGAGWKVATIIFALLAIAGCGAAAYLFLFDGTTKFLGREVVSKVEGTKTPATPGTADQPTDTPIAASANTRYIYLDGYDYALKVPDTLTYLSFNYDQFNMGDASSSTFDGNYSTLTVSAAVTGVDHQSAPEFIEDGVEDGFVILGSITIGRVNPAFKDDNLLGEPVLTGIGSDGGRNVYYDHPQQLHSTSKWSADWETKTITEIEKWLTSKDNYIKLK